MTRGRLVRCQPALFFVPSGTLPNPKSRSNLPLVPTGGFAMFYVLATLLFASPAHSAIVDKFHCRMVYLDDKAQPGFDTTVKLAAIRQPVESTPAPNITVTEGLATLATTLKEGRVQAAL